MSKITLWVTLILLSISNVSPCNDNCYECDKDTTCIACAQPFQRTASGQCILPTIDNCILYGTSNQCYKCKPTFKLTNNQCLKQFSGCVRYSATNKCLECGFGLQLSNDNCIGVFNCNKTDSNKSCSQCNDGYIFENNVCKSTMANCTEIDAKTGACKQCSQDNVLSGYRCVPAYIDPEFCYVYDSNGKCLFCKEGFTSLEGVCYTSGEIQKIYTGQNVRARRIIKVASANANENQPSSSSGSSSQNTASSSQKNQPELNQLNNSQRKPANPIDRCSKYDESMTRCLTCQNLYVLVNQTCYFGIEGCLSYQVSGKTFLCRQCSQKYELEPKTSICLLKQEDAVKDCLITSLNKLSCIICNQGFVERNGQCVSQTTADTIQPERRNCGSFDEETKKCRTCRSQDFKLENGICLDVNCDKFNSSVSNQCSQCKPYFQLNPAKGQCEYKDMNCERVLGQRCSQCSKGYFAVEAGYCALIPYGCEIPNVKTGQCSICQSDFMLLLNGTCRQQLAIQNCQTLETNQNAINKCAACIDGFYPSFDSCKKVSSRCNGYDKDSGYCIGCLAPFVFSKGKCLDENCIKESTSAIDVCDICKEGFVFKNGLCRFDDANCQVVQNNTCVLCSAGYSFVVSRNKCILNSEVNGQNNNQQQKPQPPQNTLTTESKPSSTTSQQSSSISTTLRNQLTNSEQQMAKNDSQSQVSAVNTSQISASQEVKKSSDQSQPSTQPQTSANRNNNKIENCLFQNPINPKICLECQKDFTPSPDYSSCVSTVTILANTIQKDPNCQSFQSTTKCKKCNDRFYMNIVTNRCIQVNQLCNTYDNSTGACLSCFEGFQIDAGKCFLKVKIDPYCIQKALEGCSKCVYGYFSDKNKGSTCQKLTPYCQSWNQDSGKCLVCKQGYSLVNGQCLNLVEDPNCLSFLTTDKRVCQRCVDNYFVNTMTGKCQKINDNCKTYNSATGECYTCKENYKLSRGLCQKTVTLENFIKDYFCKTLEKNVCTECYNGYYLNLQNVCKQKNPICKDIARQNGDCIKCYDGYYLVSGACVFPSNLHVDALSLNKNCKTFISTQVDSCKQCYPGYRLTGGICLQTNPLCRTSDPKTGLCTNCYDGYYLQAGNCLINLANNPNELDPYCTELSKDFTFCVKCAPGYFVGDSGSCQPLDPSYQCETYTADGKCGTCPFGHIITKKKICIQDVQYCTQYNQESICVECATGFYVKENQCFPTDIKCQIYDIKSGICNKCIPGHILFQNQCIYPTFGLDRLCTKYVNSFCTECAVGSYLFNYRCREIDVNCSKFDYQAKRCVECKKKLRPRGISCVSEN